MKHLFVPYELAKLAKEKGFDEQCITFYNKGKLSLIDIDDWFYCTNQDTFIESDNCTAPLYQQLVDFINSKGFDVKYGNTPIEELNKQLEECLTKLESIK